MQVLHLMNKMNIPAPFRKALPTPPLPVSVPFQPQPHPPPSSEANVDHISSSESEMESSDEVIFWCSLLSHLPISLDLVLTGNSSKEFFYYEVFLAVQGYSHPCSTFH